MFPFRYTSIFKSRWIALAWAGGIVVMAVGFANDHKPAAGGSNETGVDAETAKSIQGAAIALDGGAPSSTPPAKTDTTPPEPVDSVH